MSFIGLSYRGPTQTEAISQFDNSCLLGHYATKPQTKTQRQVLSCHLSRIMRKQQSEYAKTVTVKLISAFVFATRIVQFLYLLNPKFPASSHLHICACIAQFVLDLLGNHIVGFLLRQLIS